MGIVRKTKSVKAVLGVFDQKEEAISVVALVKQLKQQMNKTTVYRILGRLENAGILHAFMGKDGIRWYAKGEAPSIPHELETHPHFQCRDCNKTICLATDVSIPAIPNYKIDSVQLLLIGHCGECDASS